MTVVVTRPLSFENVGIVWDGIAVSVALTVYTGERTSAVTSVSTVSVVITTSTVLARGVVASVWRGFTIVSRESVVTAASVTTTSVVVTSSAVLARAARSTYIDSV